MSVEYPRRCRAGHVVCGAADEREGQCLVCRVASKRRYERSAKGREAQRRYNGSDKGRDRSARYTASTKGIVRRVRAELRSAYAAMREVSVAGGADGSASIRSSVIHAATRADVYELEINEEAVRVD